MKKRIEIEENGIFLVFGITEKERIKLLHFSAAPFREEELYTREEERERMLEEGFPLVQLNLSGYDRPFERHGNKYVVTGPGVGLLYQGMEDTRNEQGRLLTIRQREEESGVCVESCFQFYDGISVVRVWNRLENRGRENQTLEYLSTFSYSGIEKEGAGKWDEKLRLYIPHNGWQKELNWKSYSLADLGMTHTQDRVIKRSSKTVEVTNTGNWSSKEYLPMGCLCNESAQTGLIWQIEHNGSWHYEIADQNDHLLLNISGPTEIQSHFSRELGPGEAFVSVPAAVGVFRGSAERGFAELTRYRRMIRRKNTDNEKLPVIFNDYMNCLFADPTTEKELPLIDAAAKAGCEYYVIDGGWYASGYWWDSVGEWQEAKSRFPGGLCQVTDYIRSKGMIPGLWLEIEVMGIHSPKADSLPEDAFFVRHGKRVYDRSRYQLDFRCPAVIAHANEVVDRLIRDYGIGYIKMDYNIEPGIGTELSADSFGDGLLRHERAYLSWLDSILEKYPELVIENCSSGGLRMDYALLSRCSIQSTSDQEDYRSYAMIAANAPTAVTPEQAAVWSYPLKDAGREEVIFNMVSAMLLRIHQSGHLAEISPEGFALVREGIECYKRIRADLRQGLPYWPLGLAQASDAWMSLGLWIPQKGYGYVAVWKKRGGEAAKRIPVLPKDAPASGTDTPQGGKTGDGKRDRKMVQLYPREAEPRFEENPDGSVTVTFPEETMAAVFQVL